MLARSGTVRMPVIYGVLTHEEHPGPDVLLLERLRGVPVEAPARTPERWEQLKDQIVEGLLAWHRQDSRGCVGAVDPYSGEYLAFLVSSAGGGAVDDAKSVQQYRPDDAGQTHSVFVTRRMSSFVI
ncbi:Uncharacterised protein [Salmonella enterica subsp. enterica]|uniref:Uncharacterized protein n=1 Tax=Salmonella enterica I TaxID=59201 RepID=A0A447U626_SALET|nr:Uncharacterised protein [Salmonella enterica subsp. enterica]